MNEPHQVMQEALRPFRPLTTAEREALAQIDARLIAGAPDLLAALQRIVAVLDKQVASPHLAERASPLAQAKAAISKATGETA